MAVVSLSPKVLIPRKWQPEGSTRKPSSIAAAGSWVQNLTMSSEADGKREVTREGSEGAAMPKSLAWQSSVGAQP